MTPERAVEWMAERGRTGYRNRIRTLETTLAYAGRYWTADKRRQLRDEIEEIKREALDRYDDWATDPLP